jgi:hypothetical protein
LFVGCRWFDPSDVSTAPTRATAVSYYGTGGWVFDSAGAIVGTQKGKGTFEAKTDPSPWTSPVFIKLHFDKLTATLGICIGVSLTAPI